MYYWPVAPSNRTNIHCMPIVRSRQAVTAKWIFGQDAFTAQDYLVHTDYPAFLAKVGHSQREGILAPLSYGTGDGRSFYDFVWFDPFPGEIPFLNLMREAEDALKIHLFQ